MRTPQAKSSTLRTVTVTMGLATAVAVPLLTPTAASASASTVIAGAAVAHPAVAHPAVAHPAVAHPAVAPFRASYHFGWLQYGSRGTAVAELQRRVHVADDGIFGPITRGAVLDYQGAHRLVQDGIVGPKTGGALNVRTVRTAGTIRTARTAGTVRSSSARVPPVRTSGDPRSIARGMLAARGWSGQFSCLDRLWSRESGWKATAANPSGGAYGIPQSLPGNKMASAGADWRTNPATQIAWGLGYIAGRYGSPCAAWSHSQTHNWY